jgi:hypothetical protein
MAFPISEEQIAKTEAELGRRLPPVYRATIMKINGGMAFTDEDEWQIHPLKDTSDRRRISRTCNHVISETLSAREWRGFPPEALAIAGNGSGDTMILLPSGPDLFDETIYAFRHETGEVEAIADDFASFEFE